MSLKGLPDFAIKLFAKIARETKFNNFSIEIDTGSKPGDGFASEIFSVVISESEGAKKLDLVCKMAPENENRRKEFISDILFEREALFYEKIMPALAKFQEEKGLSKIDQFQAYPKCYGTIIDDKNKQYMIVLGDLRPFNFKMWDKRTPTTSENARITMRELGKFHGLSAAFKNQKPTEFAEFKQLKNFMEAGLQSTNTLNIFVNSYTKAIDSLKNEDHKNIARHFKSYVSECFSHCFDEKASDRFGVICHGIQFFYPFHFITFNILFSV